MEDKRYSIELEIITPLSVGAGNDNEWVKGLDFVQKDGKVYVIDMQKAVAAGVDVEALTALFLKYDEAGICKLLGSKIGDLSRYVFDLPAKTDNNIKTFLRTQLYDKPVVAGSSIKGAVRSALFNYLRTTEEKNEEVFGTMKDGTDFMRFFRIADVEMPSTVLVNTKLFNLRTEGTGWLGGWKHFMNKTTGSYNPVGFNTLYECVAPGKKGLGNISLAANTFDLLEKYGQGRSPYAAKKRELLNEPISRLFHVVNHVTKGYLLKEQAFFQKYNAERSDEVLDNIDWLLSLIPSEGSCCLLKMSAGVGFHSITGDWQFDDYDKTKFWTDGRNTGKKRYKSRKIAEYDHHLQLMGFVRLRALGQEEAVKREQALQQRHCDQLAEMQDAARQREAELLRKQKEERERQEAAAKAKLIEESYHAHIEQARQYKNEGKWDEALAELAEASIISPDGKEHSLLMEECKRFKEIEDYQRQEEKERESKLSGSLADIIKGKTSAGNLIGTTAKWLKTGGHVWGNQELADFLNEAKLLPTKEKKSLKSKLPQLTKLLSSEQSGAILKALETI